jgi:hypothetical protein
MNQNLFRLVSLSALALALIAGCVSKPARPAPQVGAAQAGSKPSPTPPRPGTAETLAQAAAVPSTPFEGVGWQTMFEGKSLAGWRETEFAGRGEVECKSGMVVMNMGDPFTGVNYTNEIPRMNYEVAYDAMRVNGSDFFSSLTFPVGDTCCSLILGGWGGGVVGLSSLDGMDASENETSGFMKFNDGQWYRIRVRVTPRKIEAWVDAEKVVNLVTDERRISVRPGDIELSQPFGLASWQTTGAVREVKIRTVAGPDTPAK